MFVNVVNLPIRFSLSGITYQRLNEAMQIAKIRTGKSPKDFEESVKTEISVKLEKLEDIHSIMAELTFIADPKYE